MVTDIQYGAALSPSVTLRAGDYDDIQGAGLVMLTAGINEKAGGATSRSDPEGRLRLLARNAEIFRDLVPRIASATPNALLLVVTDPPDALADIARGVAPDMQMFSTGTFLDSLRFRVHLARKLDVNPRAVEATVLGEHGTSAVFLWSCARVGGLPIMDALTAYSHEQLREEVEKEVREANITIIEGTGASQLGIGMVCARIAEIVARDERAVLRIGAFNPDYGVTLSLPAVTRPHGHRPHPHAENDRPGTRGLACERRANPSGAGEAQVTSRLPADTLAGKRDQLDALTRFLPASMVAKAPVNRHWN